mgnify:CR=1 FL=1
MTGTDAFGTAPDQDSHQQQHIEQHTGVVGCMKAVDQSQFELSGHFHHTRNNTIKHEGYQQTGKEQGQ